MTEQREDVREYPLEAVQAPIRWDGHHVQQGRVTHAEPSLEEAQRIVGEGLSADAWEHASYLVALGVLVKDLQDQLSRR